VYGGEGIRFFDTVTTALFVGYAADYNNTSVIAFDVYLVSS